MNVHIKAESISDLELTRRISTGETDLFEILIRRNNPHLYKIGRSYGYNPEDTKDLVQETFISAYLNLPKFENRSSLKTWLIKIMLRHCWQKQKKSSFKKEVSDMNDHIGESSSIHAISHYADTSKIVANCELKHIIENSLLQIPVEYRMVFSLREITGLSVVETADILNISESNVKVRLNRAKAMLRREIEKKYSTSDIYEFNLSYCVVDDVMKKIYALKLKH